MSGDEVRAVLAHWPARFATADVEPLFGGGGFSGARFWKLGPAEAPGCLRRWPAEHPSAEQLGWMHTVLRRGGEDPTLPLPVPIATCHDTTFVRHEGHLWELTPWLPGRADYRSTPSAARLDAALVCLARFHCQVASLSLDESVAPGLAARRQQAESLRRGGWERLRQAIDVDHDACPVDTGRQLAEAIRRRLDMVCRELRAATAWRVPCQPCIRDVHHEHVLFEGPRVSGLVDFGALRQESVSADVARLLGSLVDDDAAGWQRGLAAYQSVRPLSADEQALVGIYDRSGIVLGAANWLRWLWVEDRRFEDPDRVRARLAWLVTRLGGGPAEDQGLWIPQR